MTHTSNQIIFFGTEDFSAHSLQQLIATGFSIAAVVTKPDSKKGRGQRLQPPKVKAIALANGIPVWQPTALTEIAEDIKALQPVTGVLVSFGKIVPQSIIDLFAPGIINVHPSLLPKYRGPSPIESAIINGDEKTGISIMQLSKAMDAGPVYAQEHYVLQGDETQPALYDALSKKGAELLAQTLPSILSGSMTPQQQDEPSASYCHLLSKADARLDTTKVTASAAERKIRAHLAFPKTKITINATPVIITKAHVTESTIDQPSALDIICKNDTTLSIDEVIAPSGKTLERPDFLHGYVK